MVAIPESPALLGCFWEAAAELWGDCDAVPLIRSVLTRQGRQLWDEAGPDDVPGLARALAAGLGDAVAALHRLGREPGFRVGPTVVPDLLRALDQPDPAIRELACEALAWLGHVTAEVLCSLEDRLEDADEVVRWTAGESLAALRDGVRSGRPHGPVEAEEAFLLAVWEDPRDQAAKLIYADWLEEQGGPMGVRAAYVRDQCRVLALPEDHRDREVLRQECDWLDSQLGAQWRSVWGRLIGRGLPRRGREESCSDQ
jgi:uncharacterized protein (TIGR02996 family)